jgi:colanic acid biosynthesis glycosyl transferase WcaI
VRVLILNLYYPPDTSATAKMARMVAEALAVEHEVTVLCGRPSYDPTERRPWKLSQSEQAGPVRVVRVGSTDYSRLQMKRRVFNYLSYVMLAVPRALFMRCDVVLAMTDPPFEGIVGAFVALLKSKPYIYNIRDMYPDMAVGGSIVEPGMMTRLWERMHRWALRQATKVIVLGEDMRQRILRKGVRAENVVVVRDGVEAKALMPAAIDEEVVRAIRGDFRFVMLHAGNLGFYGAWDTLLEGAAKLKGDGVGLVFVGGGAERERLMAEASGFSNVKFLPFFPAEKVASVLAAGDIHLVTIKHGLQGVVVPSKMYGIIAAGKPILAVAPPETDVVTVGREKGFSVAADPASVDEFVAAVQELLRNPERLSSMGKRAMEAAPEYRQDTENAKLLQVVRGLR